MHEIQPREMGRTTRSVNGHTHQTHVFGLPAPLQRARLQGILRFCQGFRLAVPAEASENFQAGQGPL